VPSLACQPSRKNSFHIAAIFKFVIFKVWLHRWAWAIISQRQIRA